MTKKDPALYPYYFKGSRQYVHGTTIAESFFQVLSDHDVRNFAIKSIKFHRELRNNGQILFTESPIKREINGENAIFASMAIQYDQQTAYLYLFEAEDSHVQKRIDDTTDAFIAAVETTAPFESTSKIVNITTANDLVTALVEINKRTHKSALQDSNNAYDYRWVSLDKLATDFDLLLPNEIEVKIKHLGRKEADDATVFTLNTLSFQLHGQSYHPVIGFACSKRSIKP